MTKPLDERATRMVRSIRAREARAGKLARMHPASQRLLDALYAPPGAVTLRADKHGDSIVLHATFDEVRL